MKLAEDRKLETELTKLALQKAVVMIGDESWRLGHMTKELTKTNGIDTCIDGDTYAELVKKLEDDRKAAETTKTMLMELVSNLPAANAAVSGATSQDHSGQTTFGAYNSGLQSRVVNGGVHVAQFGAHWVLEEIIVLRERFRRRYRQFSRGRPAAVDVTASPE